MDLKELTREQLDEYHAASHGVLEGSTDEVAKESAKRLHDATATEAKVREEPQWKRLLSRFKKSHDSYMHEQHIKLDQRAANYRPADDLATTCGTCSWFSGDGWCGLVAGQIRPDYTCDQFSVGNPAQTAAMLNAWVTGEAAEARVEVAQKVKGTHAYSDDGSGKCATCGKPGAAHFSAADTKKADHEFKDDGDGYCETCGKPADEHLDAPKAKPQAASKSVEYVVAKSSDEKRFTLGPMYIPDTIDAHDEWTDAGELQDALWGFVRKGQRTIMLQHTDEPAGEWVEAVSWPFEVAGALTVGGEVDKARDVTFPAGTTFLGVVWEPWAWEMVKAGELRGFSIGGSAERIEADFAKHNRPGDHSGRKNPGPAPGGLTYSPENTEPGRTSI